MNKIMVADDDGDITRLLCKQLSRMGYEVTRSADTGDLALKLAKTVRPDLILMDIFMPGDLDGIDAASVIRRELGIPIIFITGTEKDEVLTRAQQIEPFGYILKPFKEQEVKVAIEMAFQRQAVEKRLRVSEEKFRLMISSAEDAIVLVDDAGNIDVWNNAAAELFGYTAAEIIGCPASELIDPQSIFEYCNKINEQFKKTGKSGAAAETYVLSAAKKGGTSFSAELTVSAVKLRDRWHSMWIMRDTSLRDQFESELLKYREYFSMQPVKEALVYAALKGQFPPKLTPVLNKRTQSQASAG